jgi:hypothetical protein
MTPKSVMLLVIGVIVFVIILAAVIIPEARVLLDNPTMDSWLGLREGIVLLPAGLIIAVVVILLLRARKGDDDG